MKRIFLGPALHWVFIIALVALGWIAGLNRQHVINFNPFLLIMIGITVVLVIAVLRSSPPGQQVTRDPVEDDHEDQDA